MRKLTIEITVLIAIGMVLAFIGPFGTFELPLGKRLLYWVALVLIGFPLFRGSGTAARWLADASQIPPLVGRLIAIGIASIPMTAIVAILFFRLTPDRLVDWNGVGLLYLQVWILAALITGITQLLFRDTPPYALPEDDGLDTTPETATLETGANPLAGNDDGVKLDLPIGFGPVLALKSEDHYVRVFGEGRSTLLLIRLRDAIALMSADTGFQVHRSWWIAYAAIAHVEREGRAVSITLKDGTIVPVSRGNIDTLKAHDLLN